MDDVVLLSNRGPLSWSRDTAGRLVAKRGGGGLVSGLAPLFENTGGSWVAAAMSDDDRSASASNLIEAEGLRVHLLNIDPQVYSLAYDVVSNATLWFLYHGLFDLTRKPRFDRNWRRAWDAYVSYNELFARAAAEVTPNAATVLIQDYHLTLVAPLLAELRPDTTSIHFSHTPFPEPGEMAVLPEEAAQQLLKGMTANRACGFHASRWADRFNRCCEEIIGEQTEVFVSPLGPDPNDLAHVASMEATKEATSALRKSVGASRLIVRVDRIEPSKNILRGLLALEELFKTHPQHVGNVVMLAVTYPSREGLAEYLAYRAELETLVQRINSSWGTTDWTPVHLAVSDDYPRSVAALSAYDVLLVNPIRDGLNLVAKEGAILNQNDGVLVLSRQAGAWAELEKAALGVNPFDICETAEQIAAALAMEPQERAQRSKDLRVLALSRGPKDWLNDQMSAAE